MTQERVPTRVRVSMSVWVLPTFYRSAAKQLGMCRFPVGKLLLVYLCLLYKAEGGGGGALHHHHENMGDNSTSTGRAVLL